MRNRAVAGVLAREGARAGREGQGEQQDSATTFSSVAPRIFCKNQASVSVRQLTGSLSWEASQSSTLQCYPILLSTPVAVTRYF